MKKNVAVNFMVDTMSDPLEVNKAIRGLRAVVRLGRIAEKVLGRIGEEGKFDGRAAWLDREKYGGGYVLRYSRFPKMPAVSRDDVPGYGPVVFRLARQKNPAPGPEFVNPDFVDVLISGAVPAHDGGLVLGERKVGHVRLTTNGGTLYPTEGPNQRALQLLKGVQNQAVGAIAIAIPAALCGHRAEVDPMVAVYCQSLRHWLIEDGLAERFLLDLRQAVLNYRTVKRVMTD